MRADIRLRFLRKAVGRGMIILVTALAEQRRLIGAAQARRGLNQRVEHRLEVDNDSLKSAVRWRNSFSSLTFSMAMTACLAKLLSNSICLSVKGRTSWR